MRTRQTRKGYKALWKVAADEIANYTDGIHWVLDEFGTDSASRLELVSTIIFAEREMRRKRQQRSTEELCRRVKRIKPYFTDEVISQTIEEHGGKKLFDLAA